MNKLIAFLILAFGIMGNASAHGNRRESAHNSTAASQNYTCLNVTDNSTYNCSGHQYHEQQEAVNHSHPVWPVHNITFNCTNVTDNSTYNCTWQEYRAQKEGNEHRHGNWSNATVVFPNGTNVSLSSFSGNWSALWSLPNGTVLVLANGTSISWPPVGSPFPKPPVKGNEKDDDKGHHSSGNSAQKPSIGSAGGSSSFPSPPLPQSPPANNQNRGGQGQNRGGRSDRH